MNQFYKTCQNLTYKILVELDLYKRYNVDEKYIKRLKRLIKKEYHKIYPEEMKNDEKTSND